MSQLSVDAILQGMVDALPTHLPNDDSSDLASSYEAIGLLTHAYMAALGFKLRGFNENKPLEAAQSMAPRLPPQWNDGFGSLGFVYTHKQSSMSFVMRVDRMGQKVEIRGLGVGDDKIYRVERTVRDIVLSTALPVRVTLSDDGNENRSDLKEKMKLLFTSEEAITSLLHDIKVNIIQKLIPKLQQKGYEEDAEAEETARNERRAQEARDPRRPLRADPLAENPYPAFNPLPEMARPGRPAPPGDFPPPGFEDEYEMNRPPRGGLVMPGGRSPFNIGHDDLNPPGLGPNDPFRGSFIGGGLPRPGGGSGMHPTFDDPLFGGPGMGGPDQGQGYNPQAPPGARWDPTGPGGGPRFPGPGRGNNPFGGGGGFGGGGFGGGFGGDII